MVSQWCRWVLVVSSLCLGCLLVVSRLRLVDRVSVVSQLSIGGAVSWWCSVVSWWLFAVFVGSRWFLGGAVAQLLQRQQQKLAGTRNVKLRYWG